MATNFSQTAAYIWSLADLLRGDFKQSQYGRVILPFTILRRLECVLESTKPAVLEQDVKLKGMKQLETSAREKFLLKAAGESFYNTSPMDLSKLGSSDIKSNLLQYVDSFSKDVREIFEHFKFSEFISQLDDANLLFKVVQEVAATDLSPKTMSNHEMGKVFEELLRRFAEGSSETAGEHFTPRDIVRLATSLVFMEDNDALTEGSNIRTIYDPAAGVGGYLAGGMDFIHERSPEVVMQTFGQELNLETYAICRAGMLIRGQDSSRIKLGNTLCDDQHSADKFDYMFSSPPFGMSWKNVEKEIKREHKVKGFDGRFGPGLPRVSDGSLLFLMHMMSKMKPASAGGSRLAFVSSGAPLFSGTAGSGDSEIRRYIFENDLLEAIVALPADDFYNTGIATYLWLLSNRKSTERKGKVQLINGIDFYQKVRKNFGSKRNEISEEDFSELCRLHSEFSPGPNVKILDNEDFGFRRITIQRPSRGISAEPTNEGEAKSTPNSRSYENVPLKTNINAFMKQEILPISEDAWVDEEAAVIGYSIDRMGHFGFGLEREVADLREQYQNCELIPLGRLCTEISRSKPRTNRDLSEPLSDRAEGVFLIRGVKVCPDEKRVLSSYLEMFFGTELGGRLLSELQRGMVVPSISPQDLAKLAVPVPTLEEQTKLLEAKSRIDQLAEVLARLESQLAANPNNTGAVNSTVISALNELGQLPSADVVRELVRKGESKQVEFKETFSLDTRQRIKGKHIETSALKTMVGFMNSDGGQLLIGVTDEGRFAGLQHEIDQFYKGNTDKFLLHFKNNIKDRIGPEYYDLILQELLQVDGANVLLVECKASEQPVFLDEEHFYVRTNPATDQLTGRKLAEYINRHFG